MTSQSMIGSQAFVSAERSLFNQQWEAWLFGVLEMPELKPGALGPVPCQRLQVRAREKDVGKEGCARRHLSGQWPVYSVPQFSTTQYPNNDCNTSKAPRILMLRLSAHTWELCLSKLARYGNKILEAFFSSLLPFLSWRFSAVSKLSCYFWY